MKKILMMVKVPPPVTGATMMNKVVVESRFIQNNFHVRLISVSFPKDFKDLGVISLRKFIKMGYYALKLGKELITYRPNLVYFTLSPANIALYRDVFYAGIIKLFRKNLLYHLHGKGIKENAQKSRILRRLYKYAFKNSSIICLSELIIDDVANVYSGIPFAVNYGIEDEYAAFNKMDGGRKNGPPIILFLSNYVKAKGVLDFIDALSLLDDEGYEFEGRLVGSPGSLTIEELQSIVEEEGLQNKVTIVGPKYGKDKFSEYSLADIFVFPTHFESFGLVALEAMQFGLPVIASHEGSLPVIVEDGKTGFLFPKKDVLSLKERIKKLLEEKELRINMGIKARDRFLKKFTIKIFEKNMTNVFQTCLKRK